MLNSRAYEDKILALSMNSYMHENSLITHSKQSSVLASIGGCDDWFDKFLVTFQMQKANKIRKMRIQGSQMK